MCSCFPPLHTIVGTRSFNSCSENFRQFNISYSTSSHRQKFSIRSANSISSFWYSSTLQKGLLNTKHSRRLVIERVECNVTRVAKIGVKHILVLYGLIREVSHDCDAYISIFYCCHVCTKENSEQNQSFGNHTKSDRSGHPKNILDIFGVNTL